MKEPIYNTYTIFYGGYYVEEIKAISKKNVLEHIRGKYKGKWGERIGHKYWKLKLFDILILDSNKPFKKVEII